MSVVILRGPSGAGKSTLAEAHRMRLEKEGKGCTVVSADDFHINAEGDYVFKPENIGPSHQDCFRKFFRCIKDGLPRDTVIVDNTNTRLWECAPYVLAGEAFGHDVKLIHLMPVLHTDVLGAAARNVHGVPEDLVIAMDEEYEMALPHWNEETIEVSL